MKYLWLLRGLLGSRFWNVNSVTPALLSSGQGLVTDDIRVAGVRVRRRRGVCRQDWVQEVAWLQSNLLS